MPEVQVVADGDMVNELHIVVAGQVWVGHGNMTVPGSGPSASNISISRANSMGASSVCKWTKCKRVPSTQHNHHGGAA